MCYSLLSGKGALLEQRRYYCNANEIMDFSDSCLAQIDLLWINTRWVQVLTASFYGEVRHNVRLMGCRNLPPSQRSIWHLLETIRRKCLPRSCLCNWQNSGSRTMSVSRIDEMAAKPWYVSPRNSYVIDWCPKRSVWGSASSFSNFYFSVAGRSQQIVPSPFLEWHSVESFQLQSITVGSGMSSPICRHAKPTSDPLLFVFLSFSLTG